METEWRIARAQLRELVQEKPQAGHRELAEKLRYSVAWVRKWRRRLAEGGADDEQVLQSRSHRPKTIPGRVSERMEERIIGLRLSLSEEYHRTVGARTIAAYLRQEATDWDGLVPTSSATIWRILRRRQYILSTSVRDKQPFVRPEPGLDWEIDFCTAATVSPDAPDKQQNGLEVFNVIDRGSSATIDSQASAHFDAEQALLRMAATLQKRGVPRCIIYDRDPRFVGSQATDGFPSAFTRFLLCMGCAVDILPPRRPDLKPFVERFQRTLKEECLSKYHPETADRANEHLQPYCQWYNQSRPHQGKGNQERPPQQRLVQCLPLPRIPETVDPDTWLAHYHNRHYRRHVDSRGTIQLWKYTYYVGIAYANQTASVRLDAHQRLILVEIGQASLKPIPLKGLFGRRLDYHDFLGFMCDEARSEWKQHLWRQTLKASSKPI